MAFQVRQAKVRSDAEAIHDLRVSIRRLRECLRSFKDLYPVAARKKVRKELRALMKSAERVRSADIALDLLKKAGLPETAPLVRRVHEQRSQNRTALHEDLTALASRSFTRIWREALGL